MALSIEAAVGLLLGAIILGLAVFKNCSSTVGIVYILILTRPKFKQV